jgi:hypothetical protein
MTKDSLKKIYIGASSQGASPEEKIKISAAAKRICKILDSEGYEYFADGGIKDERINVTARNVTVPSEYFPADSVVSSLVKFRLDNDPAILAKDIAMCNWVDDLFAQSLGCIFFVGRSNLGVGVEIVAALMANIQCLVLVGIDHLSSLVNGKTTRLLNVCRYRDETVGRDISVWLRKIEGGLDRDLRFLVSSEMEKWLNLKATELEFKGVPEFVRHILNQYRSENL